MTTSRSSFFVSLAALVLVAAAPPHPAVEAERAFAAMAQTDGQWTAFRAFAASHADMFTPQPVIAQEWLAGRKDPPVSVMWWPAKSWMSCGGAVVVNTGPWIRQGGRSVGYFTTVWARQKDGSWKWLFDHGGELAKPRPAGDRVVPKRGACPKGKPAADQWAVMRFDDRSEGYSADRSLRWRWEIAPDRSRRFIAEIATASGYETIVDDRVAAP
jgi:hypothetical protein